MTGLTLCGRDPDTSLRSRKDMVATSPTAEYKELSCAAHCMGGICRSHSMMLSLDPCDTNWSNSLWRMLVNTSCERIHSFLPCAQPPVPLKDEFERAFCTTGAFTSSRLWRSIEITDYGRWAFYISLAPSCHDTHYSERSRAIPFSAQSRLEARTFQAA